MTDNVNHPSHYQDGWSNGAEVIDITENLNFNRGNAVKYTARAGKKDPEKELEDLQKAEFYLQREIARVAAQWAKPDTYQVVELDVPEDDSFFVEQMDQPATPRVWDSIALIPNGVEVVDKEGDLWSGDPSGYWTHPERAVEDDEYAPFTEVLEN